jgi:hypothetical protein
VTSNLSDTYIQMSWNFFDFERKGGIYFWTPNFLIFCQKTVLVPGSCFLYNICIERSSLYWYVFFQKYIVQEGVHLSSKCNILFVDLWLHAPIFC